MSKLSSVRDGKLLEISQFGTGFIEEARTGSRFGFHVSMLSSHVTAMNFADLAGREVQFTVKRSGKIGQVKTRSACPHQA